MSCRCVCVCLLRTGWTNKTKRAYRKQQDAGSVIPARLTNRTHEDTVRTPRVVTQHAHTSYNNPEESRIRPDGQYTHPRTYTDKMKRNDKSNTRNHTQWARQPHELDRSIRKQNEHILLRRGCGKLLAYRRPSHGHRPPPYGRNRPVHATDHKPRKLYTYQTLLYYSITSKGGHTAKLTTNQYDAFARVY